MKKIWKKGQKGQFNTLKEARHAAQTESMRYKYSHVPIDIYMESDKTYSIKKPTDTMATFVMAVDKSGFKWKKEQVRYYDGTKHKAYVPYDDNVKPPRQHTHWCH